MTHPLVLQLLPRTVRQLTADNTALSGAAGPITNAIHNIGAAGVATPLASAQNNGMLQGSAVGGNHSTGAIATSSTPSMAGHPLLSSGLSMPSLVPLVGPFITPAATLRDQRLGGPLGPCAPADTAMKKKLVGEKGRWDLVDIRILMQGATTADQHGHRFYDIHESSISAKLPQLKDYLIQFPNRGLTRDNRRESQESDVTRIVSHTAFIGHHSVYQNSLAQKVLNHDNLGEGFGILLAAAVQGRQCWKLDLVDMESAKEVVIDLALLFDARKDFVKQLKAFA